MRPLQRDGYELYPAEWISGHAVYSWRLRDSFHGVTPELKLRERAVLTDPAVLEEHLARIRDGLTSDPAAAISSSKNLLESLFRISLDRSQIDYEARDIPQLYRKVADLLELKAESVPGSAKAARRPSRSCERSLRRSSRWPSCATSSALAVNCDVDVMTPDGEAVAKAIATYKVG